MAETWLLNPAKKRRKNKKRVVRKSGGRKRRASKLQLAARKRFAEMARARRRKSPRKRTRSRRRARSNPIMSAPRRRRRRSVRSRRRSTRRYGRNPPAMRGMMNDVLYAGIGYMGTKFAVGAVLPAIGISANPPSLTGIAAKFGVAYGVAFLGEKFIGSGKFQPIFIGGVVSAIQDIVALYIAPSVPALGMGAYYRPSLPAPRMSLPGPGMGAYTDSGALGAEDMI